MTTVMGEGKKKSAWQGEPAPWGAEQLFCPSWGRGEGRGRGRDHVGKAIKFLLPALLSNGCHVCVPPSCLHSRCVILFAELPLGGGCSSTVPPHPPPVLVQEPPHAATRLLGRSPPAAPPHTPSCSAQLHQDLGTEVKMRSPCMLLISSLSACNR